MFRNKRYISKPEEIEQNRLGNEKQKIIDEQAKTKALENKESSSYKNSTCKDCEKYEKKIERLTTWHRHRNSYDEHPAESLKDWQFYDRMPFQISDRSVVILRLFDRIEHFVPDIWLDDHVDVMRQKYGDKDCRGGIYDRAADQFQKQLEGHDCVAFWEALRNKADQIIKEHEERVSQKP